MKNLKFIPPIVFNISKIKIVCKRIGQMYFHLQLENQFLQIKGFWQNHKRNYVPLFNVSSSPNLISVQKKKKHTLMDQIFFKLHIADLFQSTLSQPSQTQHLPTDIANLFQSRMGMPGMLGHTNKNCMIKL